MATLRVFARNMSNLADRVRRNGPAIQRRVALAIDQTVVLATPVGNPDLWKHAAPKGYVGGHARGNWQVGIGIAPEGTLDKVDPTGAEALAAGESAIHGSKPGEDIHITNNVPYIVPLNEGHSTQAPAGFVELAIADGQAAARGSSILE